MHLAAVSLEVTGGRLHGKRSRASWVESSGRILGGFSPHFCLSDGDVLIFLSELFFFKRTHDGMQWRAAAFIDLIGTNKQGAVMDFK